MLCNTHGMSTSANMYQLLTQSPRMLQFTTIRECISHPRGPSKFQPYHPSFTCSYHRHTHRLPIRYTKYFSILLAGSHPLCTSTPTSFSSFNASSKSSAYVKGFRRDSWERVHDIVSSIECQVPTAPSYPIPLIMARNRSTPQGRIRFVPLVSFPRHTTKVKSTNYP